MNCLTPLRAAALALACASPALAEQDPALALLTEAGQAPDRMRGERVVGGVESPENAYPFYVELRRFAEGGGISMCGAAAISPRWLLTAAHCVQDRDKSTGRASSVRPAKSFRAMPGGGVRRNEPGLEVARIIPHPKYSAEYALQNDIALIELKAEVGPPYLPLAEAEPKPGTPVRIVGYGLTSFQGDISQRLREADTKTVSRQDCAIVSNKLRGAGPIDQRRICADVEGRSGLVDSCQGDSGGPLLAANAKGYWQTVGIVSYGYRCAEPGFPGVYTNVAAYRDWIAHVVTGGNPTATKPKPAPPPPPEPAGPVPASAPTALSQIAELMDFGGVNIKVLTPDGGPVKAGEQVGFVVQSRLAGNLFVFDIGRDGDARQIFPNDRTRKGRAKTNIAEGRDRRLPSQRDGFRLRAQAEGGERWIVAIVVNGSGGDRASGDLSPVSAVAATRGLEPIPDTGDYLREILSAVSQSCGTSRAKCAFGSVRIRING
ncbi:MAG: trypsin-like serine protease [Pseudomonadota bacterium]